VLYQLLKNFSLAVIKHPCNDAFDNSDFLNILQQTSSPDRESKYFVPGFKCIRDLDCGFHSSFPIDCFVLEDVFLFDPS
jgi:hypothetical protein